MVNVLFNDNTPCSGQDLNPGTSASDPDALTTALQSSEESSVSVQMGSLVSLDLTRLFGIYRTHNMLLGYLLY